MKTFKKSVLFFAVLIILSGCDNLFSPPKSGFAGGGKGGIILTIGEVQVGRTILPPSDAAKVFDEYELEFYSIGPNSELVWEDTRSNQNLSDPIALGAGNYSLHVSAYVYIGGETLLAAETLEQIIVGNSPTNHMITLRAAIDLSDTEATGVFKWEITLPDDIVSADMNITPLATVIQSSPASVDLLSDPPSSLTLPVGYYRVTFELENSDHQRVTHKEILHIYKNLISPFEYDFNNIRFSGFITVTVGVDEMNGQEPAKGTLRWAIREIDKTGGNTIIIDKDVGVITLNSPIVIGIRGESLTIEGNGVRITRAPIVTGRLLEINGESGLESVTIRRVHFTGGQNPGGYGGAIFSRVQSLTLESCVFSGNHATAGGAISHDNGSLTVKGCTFYNNTAVNWGGAIVQGPPLYIQGSLFYGNKAPQYPVIYSDFPVMSGYNVVDAPADEWGWTPDDTDTILSGLGIFSAPFDDGFYPLNVGALINVMPSEAIDDFPAFDFYGAARTWPGAPGAVRKTSEAEIVFVSFNAGEGGFPSSISGSAISGGKLYEPPEPIKENWRFAGWYKTQGGALALNPQNKWDFETDTVTTDTITNLYAGWSNLL